jgi:hypothetical protein
MPSSLTDMTDLQLVVRPRGARKMLNCGNERLYQLLNSRELDSFRDGRARLITVASIHRYIARDSLRLEDHQQHCQLQVRLAAVDRGAPLWCGSDRR